MIPESVRVVFFSFEEVEEDAQEWLWKILYDVDTSKDFLQLPWNADEELENFFEIPPLEEVEEEEKEYVEEYEVEHEPLAQEVEEQVPIPLASMTYPAAQMAPHHPILGIHQPVGYINGSSHIQPAYPPNLPPGLSPPMYQNRRDKSELKGQPIIMNQSSGRMPEKRRSKKRSSDTYYDRTPYDPNMDQSEYPYAEQPLMMPGHPMMTYPYSAVPPSTVYHPQQFYHIQPPIYTEQTMYPGQAYNMHPQAIYQVPYPVSPSNGMHIVPCEEMSITTAEDVDISCLNISNDTNEEVSADMMEQEEVEVEEEQEELIPMATNSELDRDENGELTVKNCEISFLQEDTVVVYDEEEEEEEEEVVVKESIEDEEVNGVMGSVTSESETINSEKEYAPTPTPIIITPVVPEKVGEVEKVPMQPTAAPAGPKLWTSLFNSKSGPGGPITTRLGAPNQDENKTTVPNAKSPIVNNNGTPKSKTDLCNPALKAALLKATLNYGDTPYQPRGLVNRSNWCYINATLQALLACPAFFNLLKGLPDISNFPDLKGSDTASLTPIMDSMIRFVNEFSILPVQKNGKNFAKSGRKREDIEMGVPFEPVYFHRMIERVKKDSFKGRQEDAEELLSCILNGLHEEMLTVMKVNNKNGQDHNGDVMHGGFDNGIDQDLNENDWQQVGRNNKGAITRSTNLAKSPISEIFGGQLCSALLTSGSSPTFILESFFSLQLDIQSENVGSVEEALRGMVSKEPIEGYTCSKTNKQIEASKKLSLETPPLVLVLHLKRFVFDKDGGCKKLNKKIDFPMELELSKLKDLMSQNRTKYGPKQRSYNLFAVVSHEGAEAAKGHYITDVHHLGMWLRTDDSRVTPIGENKVLRHSNPNRVPYLLYYRRRDTVL